MAAAATTTTTGQLVATVLLCAAAAFLAADAAKDKDGSDLVSNMCANVRHFEWSPLLTRKFCESVLRSDKWSAAAKDARELALVAMDLLQSAIAAADAKVEAELRAGEKNSKSSGSTAAALNLRYCRLDYDAMNRTVPLCRAMVDKFKAPPQPCAASNKDYFDCMARLGSSAADCWGYLLDLQDEEVSNRQAVAKAAGEAFQRASLVRALLEIMLMFYDDNH